VELTTIQSKQDCRRIRASLDLRILAHHRGSDERMLEAQHLADILDLS
jgi:hypothetical protein